MFAFLAHCCARPHYAAGLAQYPRVNLQRLYHLIPHIMLTWSVHMYCILFRTWLMTACPTLCCVCIGLSKGCCHCRSAVGSGTVLQAGRSRVRFPMVSLEFFIDDMALGLTQPLTEMGTRNISWGKDGRCVGLTALSHSYADCLEIWEPQPPGTHRACLLSLRSAI